MKLSASAQDTASIAATWNARATVRVAPFLDDAVAHEVRAHLRAQAYGAAPMEQLRLQYEVFTNIPEKGCDHYLCKFARWMWDELPPWLERATGRKLAPPLSRELVAMIYRRGSYLDPHNDRNPGRRVAFVLGLTADWWPPEHGGHLEFVDPDDEEGMRLVERRDPGWNTLDLFAVDTHDRIHQVPQLTVDVERLTIGGWFT